MHSRTCTRFMSRRWFARIGVWTRWGAPRRIVISRMWWPAGRSGHGRQDDSYGCRGPWRSAGYAFLGQDSCWDVMRDLNITHVSEGHLYPDLRKNVIKHRHPGWRPIFGQSGSADGVRQNQGIPTGDIFLFSGGSMFIRSGQTGWRLVLLRRPFGSLTVGTNQKRMETSLVFREKRFNVSTTSEPLDNGYSKYTFKGMCQQDRTFKPSFRRYKGENKGYCKISHVSGVPFSTSMDNLRPTTRS